MDIPVCEIKELGDGKATGRNVQYNDREIPVIVFSQNQLCAVFLNSCPHTGVRLEWRPDDFLDHSTTYFQCAMHGALFNTDNGGCIEGPCVGASLIKLDSFVKNKTLYLRSGQDIPDSARR